MTFFSAKWIQTGTSKSKGETVKMLPSAVREAFLDEPQDDTGPQGDKPSVGKILWDHLAWILSDDRFTKEQRKAAGLIASCRTPSMGTYIDYCPKCKKVVSIRYRSCNNRNCPGCQHPLQEKWIKLRKAEVIEGVPYFHIVLTLPHELNTLIELNASLLLGNLFRSSAQAVIQMCADPKYLGAKPGIVSVLHTWTQDLQPHYHIHMICTAAGITPDGDFISVPSIGRKYSCDIPTQDDSIEIRDEQAERCMEADPEEPDQSDESKGFFLPLKALTNLFRGKYMANLRAMYTQHKLRFPAELDYLNDPSEWKTFCFRLYEKKWIGYLARTFNGHGNAIDYLARYTFRTAISNSRIVEYDGNQVTILVRDNDNPTQRIRKVLNVHDFISRFLKHVLPKGFTRVRFYGFLSNAQKHRKLRLIFRKVSGKPYKRSPVRDLTGISLLQLLFPEKHIGCCSDCGSALTTYMFGNAVPPRSARSRAAPAHSQLHSRVFEPLTSCVS